MIELQDQTNSTSSPVIKAQKIGEVARIALVRWEQRAMLKDGAEVINPRTGKPRNELIVHGIALPGFTALVGKGDQQDVPEPGAACRFILRGKGFGQWIDARKAHRNGKLCVGDVVSRVIDHAQAYDASGAPKGGRITSQAEADRLPRSTTIGFYGELQLEQPSDEAWVQQAEATYTAWQESQRTQLPDDGFDEFG
jgi:hypothetical protein